MSELYILPSPLRGQLDPWNIFVKLAPDLVTETRHAAEWQADSYRDFNVSAIAMAISKNGGVGFFSGANFKPYAGGPKQCAENTVIDEVKAHKFDRILAMIVIGPPQKDEDSMLEPPTLHPCFDCRTLISKSAPRDSLIMTVDPQQDSFEMYTPAELEALHRTAEQSDVPEVFGHYVDPGFETWQRGAKLFDSWHTAGVIEERLPSGLSQAHLARLAVTGQVAA